MRHCCTSAYSEGRIWLTMQKLEGNKSLNFLICRVKKISRILMEKLLSSSKGIKIQSAGKDTFQTLNWAWKWCRHSYIWLANGDHANRGRVSVRMCEVGSYIWGTLAQRTKKKVSVQQMGHVCIAETPVEGRVFDMVLKGSQVPAGDLQPLSDFSFPFGDHDHVILSLNNHFPLFFSISKNVCNNHLSLVHTPRRHQELWANCCFHPLLLKAHQFLLLMIGKCANSESGELINSGESNKNCNRITHVGLQNC